MGEGHAAAGSPRPVRNDRRGQVSWLPVHRDPPAFPAEASGVSDGPLPGYSCGGSAGFEPASLLDPIARITRDVAGP